MRYLSLYVGEDRFESGLSVWKFNANSDKDALIRVILEDMDAADYIEEEEIDLDSMNVSALQDFIDDYISEYEISKTIYGILNCTKGKFIYQDNDLNVYGV